MKAIAMLIITAVIVLGAQLSQARQPHPEVKFKVLEDQSFALYLGKIGHEKLKISLMDNSGHMLYNKTIDNKNSFKRKLNLHKLPAGNYRLEISDLISTRSYPIFLANKSLIIAKDEMITVFKPILNKSNNTVSLSLFSPAKYSHTLKIYNEHSEVVHGEEIEEKVNYHKQFDFSKALPGSYSIVVKTQGHQYSYLVPIK